MVAFCDHLSFLFFGHLEHEIFRESILVSLDLLIQSSCWNTEIVSEISINNYFFTSDKQNTILDRCNTNIT